MYKQLFALLLLASAIFAVRDWQYEDATDRICFTATSGTSGTGAMNASWYDMVLIALPHNGTFWNGTLLAYQNSTDREDGLFAFAQNSSHAWVAVPLFTTGTSNNYCIYGGGDDRNTPADAAPYNLGWDSYDELTTFTPYSNGTTSIASDGDYVNMSSTGYYAFGSASYATYHNPQVMVKFRRLNGDNTSVNSLMGAFSPNGLANVAAYGFGIGIRQSTYSMRWYTGTTNIGPYDDSWHIYRMAAQRGAGTDYGAVYDSQFNLNNSTSVADTALTFGAGSYLAYVRNASAEFDWAMEFDYHSGITNWTSSAESWMSVSQNITFLSPEWGADYLTTDGLILRTRFDGAFDNCSVYLNDVSFANYTSVAYGQEESEILMGTVLGENEVYAACYASGVQYQRYLYFDILGGDAAPLFEDAFGSDLTDNCTAAIQTALGVCTESYNLSDYYDFGAVICPDLDTSAGSFSCLALSNTTKNGYTIFYRSPTMTYVTSINVQHQGAEWYYGASPVEGGIEIINSTQFVYLPAQDRMRDCDIYYSSSSYCSYSLGFVLNQGSVIVSDRTGNWYMTGGLGIPLFDSNYSMMVIPVQLQFLVPESTEVFPQGIYTRASCRTVNNSYAIDIVNTRAREFTVAITGTATGYTVTATSLHDSIPLNGTTSIVVSDESRVLCQYGTGDLIFLPFDFGGVPDVFANVFVSIFMLFIIVISAVVPYALVMAFVVNDLYSLITVEQMALMGVMAGIGGIITNITSFERGVKHMLVLVVIVLCYMSAMNIGDSSLGIDTTDYDNLLSAMETLTASHSFESMAWGVATFIISLFVFLLKLPLLLTGLVFGLLKALSPVLYTAAGPFWNILYVGGNIWLYVKAYEVIANRFRGV